MQKLYPVVDRIDFEQREKLGLPKDWTGFTLPSLGIHAKDIAAIRTGEYRKPRKGEWYLSGAIVEAYQAKNDLDTPYQIAKLVKTKTTTKTETVIVP
jgi:hypothetical protein